MSIPVPFSDDDQNETGSLLQQPGVVRAPSAFLIAAVGAFVTWTEEITERFVLCVLRSHGPLKREVLRTAKAKRILSELRKYAVVSALLFGIGAAAMIWLVVRGTAALGASGSEQCDGPMRQWLRSFGPAMWVQGFAPPLVVLGALARCDSRHVGWVLLQHLCPFLSIALFGWCAGVAASVRPPESCPALQGLAFEIMVLQCFSSCVVVTTDACLLEAQPLFKKLGSILSGRSAAETLELLEEVPDCAAPPDEECAVCLGCLDKSEGEVQALQAGRAISPHGSDPSSEPVRWLQLPCGHHFHKRCLHACLLNARSSVAKHCPMCRCSLREKVCPARSGLAGMGIEGMGGI